MGRNKSQNIILFLVKPVLSIFLHGCLRHQRSALVLDWVVLGSDGFPLPLLAGSNGTHASALSAPLLRLFSQFNSKLLHSCQEHPGYLETRFTSDHQQYWLTCLDTVSVTLSIAWWLFSIVLDVEIVNNGFKYWEGWLYWQGSATTLFKPIDEHWLTLGSTNGTYALVHFSTWCESYNTMENFLVTKIMWHSREISS